MDNFTTIENTDLATIHGGDDASDAMQNAGRALSKSGHDINEQLHQGAKNFKNGDWLGALGHDLRATYDVAAAGPKLVSALWPK